MTPYEVMLSESQERMLLFVEAGQEATVTTILEKWDLPFTLIGRVTDDGRIRIQDEGQPVADLPVSPLTSPPLYTLEGVVPDHYSETRSFDLATLALPEDKPGEILLRLLASPNIASKRPVFRQYDHQVQTNTVQGPGGDAAVLRLRQTNKAIALSTDGNGRYTYLDPYQGGAIAVAEACRNVSCVGARPLAITDCLNFGNPEDPQIYFQLEQAITGMADACRALGVPVVSGNVSLYNEADGQAIFPTPVVGAVGVLDDASLQVSSAFQNEGDIVLLLGAGSVTGDEATLGGSEYLELVHGVVAGVPAIDLDLEARLQQCVQQSVAQRLLSSAHDCSDGGLAVAIAESAIQGGQGFGGGFPLEGRWDAAFFGEATSRIIVSLAATAVPQLQALAARLGVPLTNLGVVGGSGFTIGTWIDVSLSDIADAWNGGLEQALSGQA
jgi:phosphoribosylformylglycinamidine synthase